MTSLSHGFLRMLAHQGLDPVEYTWCVANYASNSSEKQEPSFPKPEFLMKELLGKKIGLTFSGKIRCVDCGKTTKKSFNQGSCFSCFQSLAQNDLCILKPETCHFHLGTCREPDWGEENCFIKHTVYLSNTSGLKVGITKENPVSNRWVDQGAQEAIAMLEVSSRRDAGVIEFKCASIMDDKTRWQTMVTTDSVPIDLVSKKKELLAQIESWDLGVVYQEVLNNEITKIKYPVLGYPKNSKSFHPEKDPEIHSRLIGIKGQYLLFEDGVINLRAYGGYEVELSLES
ncbi:hypothetical protein CH373_16090 [Leptospira perolatii]|uniref:DUF2797 domain-containing protein n=1 Tax=Leptospira perolatii TaxID=2023191 RepID=A0A2M9ZJ77_9LEPT|nr:DUF2797 domain-containing protein [Leptospira perolatii]PJZ68416.1 hypothetical protein CH360_16290 [Leptospira perolatii]PJZ72115.1 hypothetical protein CH373_16090 [Leptospira perolatii]